MHTLEQLRNEVTACVRCPRLRKYCHLVAREKRRAYLDWEYWGKPVSGFGDPSARIWIIGLAPAAHGANRTGRVFTGDRSGDFLFAALYRAGLANQPISQDRNDGLQLNDVYISATVRCAPPANKPLPREIANCSEFLDREWQLLKNVHVILALGKIGWNAAITLARRNGHDLPQIPPFSHGVEIQLSPNRFLIGSYHVSQQNTFTGKLTEAMFDRILSRCKQPYG
ncbi:MAG: uracil-DNA glycosylase [Tepidisphaeraceae bacterium]|jgi:uracil-DNA glycosylase family 4